MECRYLLGLAPLLQIWTSRNVTSISNHQFCCNLVPLVHKCSRKVSLPVHCRYQCHYLWETLLKFSSKFLYEAYNHIQGQSLGFAPQICVWLCVPVVLILNFDHGDIQFRYFGDFFSSIFWLD